MSDIDNASQIALSEFLAGHNRWFVLTGAGVSTASGLGDYRDASGQWKRAQPMTGQLFLNNEAARKRYWARSSVGWKNFSHATPNPAHHTLVQLQKKGIVQSLVTQNVDCLHQQAGHKNVIDLHGVLNLVRCISCLQSESRDNYQIKLLEQNPWLNTLDARYAPDGDAELEHENFDSLVAPHCKHCSNLMKPDVVFFGENVPKERVQSAMQALMAADALVVLGSSLMVYSGYRFCKAAFERGQTIVIVNQGKTRADDIASLKINANCVDILAQMNSYYDKI